jgi:hypothetical protein
MNTAPLGNQILSISYVSYEVHRYMSVSHPIPITQMFQPSGFVVMSIAATRMHRSLTDFTGYYASLLFRSVLVLTAAEVAVLLIPIRLVGHTR